MVFEGVEAMPVEAEVEEEQSPAAGVEWPELAEESDDEGAVKEDGFECQECGPKRILPSFFETEIST